MEAIILAGGFGTRLKSVVPDLPKPMAPIQGKPFLEILLTMLAKQGFNRIVLSLGFLAEKIVAHFGSQFAGMHLEYEIENSPLGTGGAIRSALQRCTEDHVFVFNGDTYLKPEISDIEQKWSKHKLPIIVARHVDDTSRYGRIETADGLVTAFSEKGMSGPGLINAGCYIIPTDLYKKFPEKTAFSFETEYLMGAVKDHSFEFFVSKGMFIDIGVPEDYFRAQKELDME